MHMKNKFIALMLVVSMLTTPISFTYAGSWGESMAAAKAKQMMEEIFEQIKNAINAAAKMAAIKQATSTIEDLLYGGNSSPRSIQNFEEFLVQNPHEEAMTFGQDFLTSALRGRTSGDYTMSASGSGGIESAIEAAGQGVIDAWSGENQPTVDLADYCSNTSDVFADGDWACYEALWSNSYNTPIGMAIATDRAMSSKFMQEKEIANLIATSSGSLPQFDENGNVSLTSDMVASIARSQAMLPLEALANGDSNIFSSLIQSFAITLLTRIVNQGLSETQESFDKNNSAFQKQYKEEFGSISNSMGPGSSYSMDQYDSTMKQQNSNTWVNPDTGRPMTTQ